MLRFSRLQSALIIGVCLLGLLLCVPNFVKPGVLPAWIPQRAVNLGLDLQGGSYLVLEVDTKTVAKERLLSLRTEVRQALIKARVATVGIGVADQGVSVQLSNAGDIDAARKALADVVSARTDAGSFYIDMQADGTRLTLRFTAAALAEMNAKAAEQSVSIVRRSRLVLVGSVRPLGKFGSVEDRLA